MRARLLLIFVLIFVFPAFAEESLSLKAIRQTVATAFSQTDLKLQELSWVQEDRGKSGVKAEFVQGSLEWVRVSEALAFIRAVTRVTADSPGTVEYLGQIHPLRLDPTTSKYRTEILTAVRTDPSSSLKVKIGSQTSIYHIEFLSREDPSSIGIDLSCSSYKLEAKIQNQKNPKIFSVGCRDIHDFEEEKRRVVVEVEIDLGSRQKPVQIDGQDVEIHDGVLRFRMNSDTNTVRITDPEAGDILITAQIPPRFYYLNLGFGLGPYRQLIQSPIESSEGIVTLATIYGSYFVTESSRLVFFNATSVKSFFFSDSGFYFNSESFRILDRRVSINLMLGFNAVGLGFEDATRFRLGFPQGFEMIYRDAFQKNATLQAGAFIYPKINSSAYYNIWLRYGKRGFFGELNYISVRDDFGSIPVYTRNFGVSFGFPLARFF